ncbi:MAG: alpha/beta fold hydrolase [Solirubrobacterales bacterium]|nr:alpha/beta fold hydrolase [Solirubrobacterales bacterium]MBV9809570.1 alpha/beta fold hydrolase [Solirubrobacterales bacterium]
MKLEARLLPVGTVRQPRGAVVVLHGGARRRENMRVSPAQLSVLRMIPIARRIAREGRGELVVFRLLNSRRGWETEHTPVHDVRWALEQIPEMLRRTVPVCLVGHSLGGRAALLAAGEPSVAGAVALAPWVLPSDDPRGVEGKPLLIVHGSEDRVASPARAAALAARLHRRTEVSFVLVDGARHAMLRHHREFARRAAEFVTATLLQGPGSAQPAIAQRRSARSAAA